MRKIDADNFIKELKQEDELIDIGDVIDLVEEQPTVNRTKSLGFRVFRNSDGHHKIEI